MLQCVAVCTCGAKAPRTATPFIHCSVAQCVAVHCNVLKYDTAQCSMLQSIAACCSALQCVAVCGSVCSVLQCVAVCTCGAEAPRAVTTFIRCAPAVPASNGTFPRNTASLQYVAARCSMLQCCPRIKWHTPTRYCVPVHVNESCHTNTHTHSNRPRHRHRRPHTHARTSTLIHTHARTHT